MVDRALKTASSPPARLEIEVTGDRAIEEREAATRIPVCARGQTTSLSTISAPAIHR